MRRDGKDNPYPELAEQAPTLENGLWKRNPDGTMEITWIPDAHPRPSTMGSGKVIVTFQGLINTSELVSPTSKFYS